MCQQCVQQWAGWLSEQTAHASRLWGQTVWQRVHQSRDFHLWRLQVETLHWPRVWWVNKWFTLHLILKSFFHLKEKPYNLLSSFLTETLQWTAQNDITDEDNQPGSPHISELTVTRSPFQSSSSFSLADLLAIYRALGDRQPPQQQQVFNEPKILEKPQLSKFSGEDAASSFADNWPMSNRKKRNFSLGVAGMCCSQGCTKNDIGRLCWMRSLSKCILNEWRDGKL